MRLVGRALGNRDVRLGCGVESPVSWHRDNVLRPHQRTCWAWRADVCFSSMRRARLRVLHGMRHHGETRERRMSLVLRNLLGAIA
jgi:hypothetical protein